MLNKAPQPNRSTKAKNLHFCPYCYKPLLAEVAAKLQGYNFENENMSYDEQRISDQIDGGLLQQKREHIKRYVKQWMDGHEPDTFVKNEHGNVIYSAGHSSLNLVAFFENLLEDYLDENGQ